jgi:hypothetical protein
MATSAEENTGANYIQNNDKWQKKNKERYA